MRLCEHEAQESGLEPRWLRTAFLLLGWGWVTPGTSQPGDGVDTEVEG